MSIQFSQHKLDTIIEDVVLAKLGDLTNPPDKRIGEEGKAYTPPVVTIVCKDGRLNFVLDDIVEIIPQLSGAVIKMSGGLDIRIKIL